MAVRAAIKELWRQGAPKEKYLIADDVPNTPVDLEVTRAPFEDVVSRLCGAVQLKYDIRDNTYFFTVDPNAASTAFIKVVNDKCSLDVKNADLESVVQQVLETFRKASDVNINGDPTEELKSFAQRRGQMLAAPSPPGIPGLDMRSSVKNEAQIYIKPPKPRSGVAKITMKLTDFTFIDTLDALSKNGGFLWFLRNNKYIIRNTTSPEKVRDIFKEAGIWDQLQK